MLLKRSICLIILLFSSPLFSQDRSKSVALIIGNSSYKNQPPLKNTIHDAIDINKTLLSLGFETIYKTNVTRKEMREAIRLFGKKLSKAKVALVYYSGHGIQVKGRNYLIPINTNIESEDEIQDEAVDAGSILRKMERAACSINIIILDACRNNPFARGFRSVNTGLAQMDAPKGSLLVYATAPGRTAGDGKGRNGIFTKSLLRYMKKPNLEIAQVFKKVTRDVSLETRNKQIPWTSSSLTEDFYFIKNKNKASSDIFIGKVTKVKIANLANKTTLAPGETAHFYAKVYNEKGNVVNKPVFWNVIGTRYGNVLSQNFRFQSPKQGDFVIEIKEPASNITKMVFMHVKGNPVFLPNQQLQNKQPLVGRVKNEKTKSDANTIYVYSEDQAQIISTFYYVKTKVYNIGAIKYRVREYLHKETNLPFILIPGGSFYMGDTSKERPFYRTDKDEKPIRLVHLKPFLMSKYEVTQSAWIMATGNNPWKKQKKRGFYKINGPDYPVVNFSWEKSKAFAELIGLSLPSEAQWEYACKSGTKTRYYWGDKVDHDYAWHLENVFRGGDRHPRKVGKKLPNAFGLYDMLGNVSEWCLDTYQNTYKDAPTDGSAWILHKNRNRRIYRGGNFGSRDFDCYSSHRSYIAKDYSSNYVGIRLVYNLPKDLRKKLFQKK